jgi:hypothetical protein
MVKGLSERGVLGLQAGEYFYFVREWLVFARNVLVYIESAWLVSGCGGR